MVKKYSELYRDARKALIPIDGPHQAGVTARELLILVGREDCVAAMTENAQVGRRYSGLKLRLQGKVEV